MMLTFRAGKVAALAVGLFLAGCSREQQDWRAAEAADTVESYDQFLERHPESELATAARTRLAQLTEDREWQQAGNADTPEAYRDFLAHHPDGKWAQEARIRIQNFALNGLTAEGAPAPEASGTAAPASAAAAVTAPVGSAAPPGAGRVPEASALPSTTLPGESAALTTGTVRLASAASSSAGTAAVAATAPASPGELAQPPGSATGNQLSTPYVSTPRSAQAAGNPVATPAAAIPAAATPARAVPLSTANPGSGQTPAGYGIQLGAFTSEAAANAAWQQLATRFSSQLQGLASRVVPANTNNGTLFRLQAQVADESRARALCDMLKQQSQGCVPVLPH